MLTLEYRFAAEPGQDASVIIRRTITGVGETFEIVNGRDTRAAMVRGRHVNLTLRRKGDDFTLLHFDPRSGGWVAVARFKQALGADVYAGVSIAKTGASPVDLYVFLRPGSPVPDEE